MTEFVHPYATQAHVEIRSTKVQKADGDVTEWYWSLVHNNGSTVATTGETYVDHAHALEMVEKLWPGMPVVGDQ